MTAESNDALIQRFYAAFARLDGAEMAACYAPGATFSDPIYAGLTGEEPGAMWRMLTGKAANFEVELVDHSATETAGSARWIAQYTFGPTRRPVTNDVRSSFRFAGGLIAEQRDDFDFHRWAGQALGPSGRLLGWAPPLRAAVRRKSRAQLTAYLAAPTPTGQRSKNQAPARVPTPATTGPPAGRHLDYAPRMDGRADPGEVVWTWVAYEEDPAQGKDRPVLVVGRSGPTLLGLMLSSQRERDGQRNWQALGPGAWDGEHRPSWVRLDRVLAVAEEGIRREGAVLERSRFEAVARTLRSGYGWA